eukprot:TRINITY_DN13268_c0_g1_i1.p1 TRINITY_DN13268_c0_g1~~TRINITY_DN13268_c0_g1_i1.p1  ORF type:complete len:289 (+),score=69.09 TRINITY_DN13268_c0_g1_i1:42-908(+)
MSAAAAEPASEVTVRWVFRGGRTHRGKLMRFQLTDGHHEGQENEELKLQQLVKTNVLSSEAVLEELRSHFAIDLNRFQVFWFNSKLSGYERLAEGTGIPLDQTPWGADHTDVVDLELEEKPEYLLKVLPSKITNMSPTGFFGVGIYRGRRAESLSVLWRSAFQMGASFVFTIGARHGSVMESEDCQIAFRTIPMWRFENWEDFVKSAPFASPIVALEMGGTPLESFSHPPCCIYLLGSEEDGLPKEVVQSCPHVVEIPTVRARSFSIAAAGSIVLYDRLAKLRSSPAE